MQVSRAHVGRIHRPSTPAEHGVCERAGVNAKHRLGQADVATNLAVHDISRARSFYGDVLGLDEVGREGEHLLTYRSGSSLLFVYQSEFAGSNRATAASWLVGDRVDEIVGALKAEGVVFEHYDMPDLRLEGDVHVGHGMRVAWFKDPDGNILSLVSG